MKNLMLSGLVFASAFSAKAIEFKTGISSDPLKIKLVRVDDCRFGQCYLYDEANNRRFIISTNSKGYLIYNSKGFLISLSPIDINNSPTADQLHLVMLAKNVTASCPLTIEVDRNTIEIKKASLQCDPLALETAELNEG